MSRGGIPRWPQDASPAIAPVVVAAARRSWLPVGEGDGFPLQSLPLGVIAPVDARPRVAARLGDAAVDLAVLAADGLLGETDVGLLAQPTLNPLLQAGRPAWTALRHRLVEMLADDGHADAATRTAIHQRAVHDLADVSVRAPVAVSDFVDFSTSRDHVETVSRLFRPHDVDPLPPAWRHQPLGYHGRAGTVVASGTPIRRPQGLRAPSQDGEPPVFGPTRQLDHELEVGFVCGGGPDLGEPIHARGAARHVFGVVLVNDWSARDVQAFESRPLGPFVGKSFATTMSTWVVPLDALLPACVAEPEPLAQLADYLQPGGDWALDLTLEVAMAPPGGDARVVARCPLHRLQWTLPQLVAHTTVGGATLRPGDLLATGAVSGPEPDERGCLLEATRGGAEPVDVGGGHTRAFWGDGDEIVLRGRWVAGQGPPVALGEARGRVEPAWQG